MSIFLFSHKSAERQGGQHQKLREKQSKTISRLESFAPPLWGFSAISKLIIDCFSKVCRKTRIEPKPYLFHIRSQQMLFHELILAIGHLLIFVAYVIKGFENIFY